MSTAIEVEALVKGYAGTTVVDGISFTVDAGEIFGIVGPNGAGKTTTVECIEGLRAADGGRLRTLGLDPAEENRGLRERIGVQLQESSLPPKMKVREALELFAAFYERPVDSEELLDRLAIGGKAESSFATLSGGQKQRLFIALALINDPELVFLDELTTGLDPHARHAMWELVLDIRERGKTVVLTTHFMEEAERLCDRLAILDSGRIVALDTPSRLIDAHGGGRRLLLEVAGAGDLVTLETALGEVPGVRAVTRRGERFSIDGEAEGLTHRLLDRVREAGAEVRDLRSTGASLEEVYLALTGRPSLGAGDERGALPS